eukprot:comp20294_c0_seq2/m.40421 comp20294_c0_seq2/g.40421  ORF comp20294_c0_seq2/g.40421 comp20294_c0_seq2/m.40421 type:complete len:553 (+) comp20294_c0_seq2:36-1694(+)
MKKLELVEILVAARSVLVRVVEPDCVVPRNDIVHDVVQLGFGPALVVVLRIPEVAPCHIVLHLKRTQELLDPAAHALLKQKILLGLARAVQADRPKRNTRRILGIREHRPLPQQNAVPVHIRRALVQQLAPVLVHARQHRNRRIQMVLVQRNDAVLAVLGNMDRRRERQMNIRKLPRRTAAAAVTSTSATIAALAASLRSAVAVALRLLLHQPRLRWIGHCSVLALHQRAAQCRAHLVLPARERPKELPLRLRARGLGRLANIGARALGLLCRTEKVANLIHNIGVVRKHLVDRLAIRTKHRSRHGNTGLQALEDHNLALRQLGPLAQILVKVVLIRHRMLHVRRVHTRNVVQLVRAGRAEIHKAVQINRRTDLRLKLAHRRQRQTRVLVLVGLARSARSGRTPAAVARRPPATPCSRLRRLRLLSARGTTAVLVQPLALDDVVVDGGRMRVRIVVLGHTQRHKLLAHALAVERAHARAPAVAHREHIAVLVADMAQRQLAECDSSIRRPRRTRIRAATHCTRSARRRSTAAKTGRAKASRPGRGRWPCARH